MTDSSGNKIGTDFNFQKIVNHQSDFFKSNKTKDIGFRKQNLKKLLQTLKDNEELLYKAIYTDFKKSAFETYETELALIYHEIKLAIKKLPKWSSKKSVGTDMANLPGKSYLMPEPLGNTLVIGAWNYPYQLSILPAVASIAAGNTVIIKPSELAANTSSVMAEIINTAFAQEYFHIIEGGIPETTELLKQKFDKIFYTGSSMVGKIVMKAASENLCPVVLELGGKSPAFVLDDANIKMAARRIVYGKFLNGGQTCVAPDYILVHKSIKEKLINEIIKQVKEIHGDNPIESEAFVRIITPRHFDRLVKLIDAKKVVMGGDIKKEELYIAPTLLDNVDWEDIVMQEEIFGPILPVIEFEDLDDAITKVKEKSKPLALYLFTRSSRMREKVFNEISFGGGMLNDTLTHLTNANLPFGGVGYSGMGNYHGKFGFDAFSHQKSIIHKTNLIEPFIKYPPYTKLKSKIIKWVLE